MLRNKYWSNSHQCKALTPPPQRRVFTLHNKCCCQLSPRKKTKFLSNRKPEWTQICVQFALNCIFFPANKEATLKTKQPIRFQGLFEVIYQIAGNERQRVSCSKFCNFCFQNSYFFPQKMDEFNFKSAQYCINKIFELTKSCIWAISKWM